MPIKFDVTGNIATEPTFDDGVGRDHPPVFRCAVFVDRFKPTDDGGVEEVAGFIQSISVFGDRAEDYFRLLRKGMRITAPGRVSPNDYQSETDNIKVKGFNFVADKISLELSRVESITMKPSRKSMEEDLAATA